MTMEESMSGEVDRFPIGMRVLAVDDNPTCLMVLVRLLRECQYHVTTANQARIALKMLRENGYRFDLIISDVQMPDMDCFKLLELVGLEMDLSVIMLSGDNDPKLVMKGIMHGACYYLAKPVKLEELRNIWQHVTRRKKPRVVWSVDLHRKFVAAVNQLGIDKAVPKKILDMMNVEGLTRDNVASHLQKYRLYLKRISMQQANMVATFGGKDSSYIRVGPVVDGIGDFETLTGSERLSNTALSSYPPSGIFSRLNRTYAPSFSSIRKRSWCNLWIGLLLMIILLFFRVLNISEQYLSGRTRSLWVRE